MSELSPELQTFLKQQLRRLSYKWPAYNECWKRAKGPGRGWYYCAAHRGLVQRKDARCDHIEPVIPVTGWDGLVGFCKRLFCEAEKLQILCTACHQVKTNAENEQRRMHAALQGR